MKHVITIEDTPQGISFAIESQFSGTSDHFADSLSTHITAFVQQHINYLTSVSPLLVVLQEKTNAL